MSDIMTKAANYPVYDAELFTDDALLHPFEHYKKIQELGPVVRINEPYVLALSRYEDVAKALRTPEILISGQGTGFNDFANKLRQPGVLNTDGEQHKALRLPVMKYLSPGALRPLRPSLLRMIDEKVSSLVDGQTRNALSGIAAHLPLEAVFKLVGFPDQHRDKMVKWSAANFNLQGVIERDGKLIPELEDDMKRVVEARDYIGNIELSQMKPGSWAAALFQEVLDGGMTLNEARASMRAFVLPSLDTTINAIGNTLYELGRNSDQYQLLRKQPSLIPSAVYEGMRHTSVLRWFSRMAVSDYEAGEVFVPAGERVMLLFAAANRDPRKYKDPDKFDVTRNPSDQLSWGTGPHLCAGKHLARMEMEVLLEAMVRHVARFEVDEPTRPINRGLFGMEILPMRMYAA